MVRLATADFFLLLIVGGGIRLMVLLSFSLRALASTLTEVSFLARQPMKRSVCRSTS